ncbi:hypothetical protein FD754_014306 [Muntiacus muntjak]|uniref:Uncharacterized protein n=1 Tax=Muntiacus muntjak TaxID=9888 RepID=A0A5N3VJH7_MUNMU|nr:hypothetical protein FD754_014306 [Muntiacus muntjak]
MIAAQLLAYYFTELKDDQVKKVSRGRCRRPALCPQPCIPASARRRSRLHPPAPSLPQASTGWIVGRWGSLRPSILPGADSKPSSSCGEDPVKTSHDDSALQP